jgi:hypothetical protein
MFVAHAAHLQRGEVGIAGLDLFRDMPGRFADYLE